MIRGASARKVGPIMTAFSLPHTYVISLTRCVDRRQRIAARLQTLGLPFSFFDAIEGASLSAAEIKPYYNSRRRRLFFGRDLTPSEIGCLISHAILYQNIAADPAPLALILEDDALLGDALPAVLADIMRLHDQGQPFGLIRFLGNRKIVGNLRPLRALEGEPGPYRHALCRVYGTPGGAYGYVVSRDGAARLAAAARNSAVPIDTLHGEVWRTGIDTYAVWPSPVLPDYAIESTMSAARFDKTTHLGRLEKTVYPLTRFAYKTYEAFFKNYSAMALRLRDLFY